MGAPRRVARVLAFQWFPHPPGPHSPRRGLATACHPSTVLSLEMDFFPLERAALYHTGRDKPLRRALLSFFTAQIIIPFGTYLPPFSHRRQAYHSSTSLPYVTVLIGPESYRRLTNAHIYHCICVPDLVYHDSGGFEAGRNNEVKAVEDFLERKSKKVNIHERVHMIW